MLGESADELRYPLSSYVILGGPPYEESANQTSLQAFRELGKNDTVLYVCRRHQGSALRRFFRGSLKAKSTQLTPGLLRVSRAHYVLVLPAISDILPMVSPNPSRLVQLKLISRELGKAIRKLGLEQPVLISYWWMFPEIAQMKLWSHRYFDVVDRHWGYEYLRNAGESDRNLSLVLRTADASDRTVTVSVALQTELTSCGVSAEVLPNAVDLDRIEAVRPSPRTALRANHAVYCGGWNSRIDGQLLEHLVSTNPTWHFSFVGSDPDTPLRQYSNVTFLGDLPYDEAIQVIRSSSLGLVPFKKNAFNEASNFLKVLDYLAGGVSIAATNLSSLGPWAASFPDRIHLCNEERDWNRVFAQTHKPVAITDDETSLSSLDRWSVDRRLKILLSMP